MMDWQDERYVRLFTRDTPDWVSWPWQARALLPLLLRKVDRVGQLGLGRSGVRGLAVCVGLPEDVCRVGFDALLEDGAVELRDQILWVRNFQPAQEASMSDAARMRDHRERKRAKLLDSGSSMKRIATKRNETKRDETNEREGGTKRGAEDEREGWKEGGAIQRIEPNTAELLLSSVTPSMPSFLPSVESKDSVASPPAEGASRRACVGEVYRYWEERLGKPHLEKIPPEVWSILGKCFKSGLTVELGKEAVDGVVVDTERWPERAAQCTIAQIFGSLSRAQNFAERARKGNPKPAKTVEQIRRGSQYADDQGWDKVAFVEVKK
jgi:hypothetical protein